jgi:N-acetylmuramoyl-L-alanine amidase
MSPRSAARLRLAAALLLAIATGGPAMAEAPSALAARIVQSGDVTRLSFEVTARVEPRAFVLADPARAIVDLPEIRFEPAALAALPAAVPAGARGGRAGAAPDGRRVGQGLILSYRFGAVGPGRSRVVIDLAGPARIVHAASEPGPEGRFRLVVDLAPTDPVSFAVAAMEGRQVQGQVQGQGLMRAAASAGAVADPAAERMRRGDKPLIVIDPGHGGVDVGAQTAGRPAEKEIVLEFARALARKLEETGRFAALLTREGDVFVSLPERVRIARNAGAQLFLSIHADSLNEASVSGATVYTVSDKASDAHAARLAEKENLADKAAGFETMEDASDVSDILFDLTRRETRAYSHVFARTLVSVWKEAAGLNKNPHRSAGFRVLQAPDVPSALLELGYISHQKDAELMNTPAWRDRTAGAVARSIEAFFALREPGGAAVAGGG